MENNLIRTEELLGSRKNIVGDNKSDLILETLGKIYIKSGKLTRLLNDVFKLLDGINSKNVGSKTIITNNLSGLNYPGDGYLVFDTKENALYISYDLRYLLVIDGIDKEVIDTGFVKKKGDTMTGQLRILHNGAPLIVASNQLVKNFNANYLQGHKSDYFAAKSLDEFISGYWTFYSDTEFKENVSIDLDLFVGRNTQLDKNLTVGGKSKFEDTAQFMDNVAIRGDVVLEGSIGSQLFMSGYNGYGWRFDANTNMLTVDYLVVRKAMHVFELVVNKITATNGSLWVTDSAKIEEVFNVKTLPKKDESLSRIEDGVWYVPYANDYNKTTISIPKVNIKRPEEYNVINGEVDSSGNIDYDIFKYICKYKNFNNLQDYDPNNLNNIHKIGLLFPDSDNSAELNPTHFIRQRGFGLPLDGELPLFIHNYHTSYREALGATLATHAYVDGVYQQANYIYSEGNYKLADEGEIPTHVKSGDNYIEAQYCLERHNLYVPASAGETPEYRYNYVTKEYVRGTLDDVRTKYVFKENYNVYTLARPEAEQATHILIPGTSDMYMEYKATHIVKYEYIYDAEQGNYVQYYREAASGETATHGLIDGQYTTEAPEKTHVIDYRLTEENESPTHIRRSIYIKSDSDTARYVFHPVNGDYVLLTDLSESATHVLSNYSLAPGLSCATHVYVSTDYMAPSSNVYVPTHIQYLNNWYTKEEYSILNPSISDNFILNPTYTPKLVTVDRKLNNVYDSNIKYLNLFYRYYGNISDFDIWDNENIVNLNNIKVIKMKDDEYPPFKEGDIVRCQKFLDGNIKYYDGIIASKLDTYTYLIIIATSVFDKQTVIEYNDNGTIKDYREELNTTQYEKTGQILTNDLSSFDETSLIAGPAPEDGLVRIGHIYDRDRQNSVYITSSEMYSPYIQTISGVNRPDYTVLYGEPDFITDDKGLFEFSSNGLKIVDLQVKAKTPNGNLYFLVKNKNTDIGTESVFYAPNNNYYFETYEGEVHRIANYNTDKIKINTNARVRLGNLNGITDPMFGNKQPYGYGLFADNVFLKGEFYLNNGLTVVEFSKDLAAIESKKIAFKSTALIDNLFYASDGDNYSEIINDNLINNTNFDNVSNPTKNWTTKGSILINGFGKYNAFKGNIGEYEVATITIPITLKAGETYTLSMYAKNTYTSGNATGILLGIPGKEVSGSYQRLWTTIYKNGISIGSLFNNRSDIYFYSTPEWLRKILTFKINDDAQDISGAFITFYQWNDNSTNENYGEWAQLKLEKGNTATKYCKAFSDYTEGNPSTYEEDFGRWYPVYGQIQKSEMISSDRGNYIKGIGTKEGYLLLRTISKKAVNLTKGLKIHVLLNFLENYSNLILTLYGIKDGTTIDIDTKNVTQGQNNYSYDFNNSNGSYFLMLELRLIPGSKIDVIEFKTEIASENRIGVEASITMENGKITTNIEDKFKNINTKIEDIEGTIQEIVEPETGRFAKFEQTLNGFKSEIGNILVGGSNLLKDSEFNTYNKDVTYWILDKNSLIGCADNFGYLGKKGIKITNLLTNSSSYYECLKQRLNNVLKPGMWYTVSFYAKSTITTSSLLRILVYGTDKDVKESVEVNNLSGLVHTSDTSVSVSWLLSNKWLRYSFKFKTPDDLDATIQNVYTFSVRIYGDTNNKSDNSHIYYFSMPQLEEGTVLTAWGTNVDDLKDIITETKSSINLTVDSISLEVLNLAKNTIKIPTVFNYVGEGELKDGLEYDLAYFKENGEQMITTNQAESWCKIVYSNSTFKLRITPNSELTSNYNILFGLDLSESINLTDFVVFSENNVNYEIYVRKLPSKYDSEKTYDARSNKTKFTFTNNTRIDKTWDFVLRILKDDINTVFNDTASIEIALDMITGLDGIKGGLLKTGIDIVLGEITLTAGKTKFNGDVEIYNSNEGVVVFDDSKCRAIQLKNKSLIDSDVLQCWELDVIEPDLDWDSSNNFYPIKDFKLDDTDKNYKTIIELKDEIKKPNRLLYIASEIKANEGVEVTNILIELLDFNTNEVVSASPVGKTDSRKVNTYIPIKNSGKYKLRLVSPKPLNYWGIYIIMSVTKAQTYIGNDGVFITRNGAKILYTGNDLEKKQAILINPHYFLYDDGGLEVVTQDQDSSVYKGIKINENGVQQIVGKWAVDNDGKVSDATGKLTEILWSSIGSLKKVCTIQPSDDKYRLSSDEILCDIIFLSGGCSHIILPSGSYEGRVVKLVNELNNNILIFSHDADPNYNNKIAILDPFTSKEFVYYKTLWKAI